MILGLPSFEGPKLFIADHQLRSACVRIRAQTKLQLVTQKCHRRLRRLANIVNRLFRNDHLNIETHSLRTPVSAAMEDRAHVGRSTAIAHSRRGIHQRS